MSFFGFPSVTEFIDRRRSKFFSKFNASDNVLCCACQSTGSILLLLKFLTCLYVRVSPLL